LASECLELHPERCKEVVANNKVIFRSDFVEDSSEKLRKNPKKFLNNNFNLFPGRAYFSGSMKKFPLP